MKETFEQYLQRLKDRRTEDDYKYTDEDFKNRIHYIFDCYEKDLSVYKCLEFMYFVEREIKAEDVFNDQKKEGLKEFIDKHKQEWSKSTGDIFSDYTIGESKSIQNSMHLDAEIACRSMYRQETLEETIDKASLLEFPIKEWYRSNDYSREEVTAARDGFKRGAKWQQEQHDFLPGFIKQFDPKEGEMNGEQWTAVHFLKWLELNKFKIVK